MPFLHRPKGVYRIGDPTLQDFPTRNLCPILPLQSLLQHGQSGPIASHRPDLFQGRMRTRHKHNPAQAEHFAGSSRDKQVPERKGIKGSAKKTDPQS